MNHLQGIGGYTSSISGFALHPLHNLCQRSCRWRTPNQDSHLFPASRVVSLVLFALDQSFAFHPGCLQRAQCKAPHPKAQGKDSASKSPLFLVKLCLQLRLLLPVAPYQEWHLPPQIIGDICRRGFPCALSTLSQLINNHSVPSYLCQMCYIIVAQSLSFGFLLMLFVDCGLQLLPLIFHCLLKMKKKKKKGAIIGTAQTAFPVLLSGRQPLYKVSGVVPIHSRLDLA